MQPNQVITLFDYHWDTTERLLENAAQLDANTYHAHSEYGAGSIHKLFFHLIAANHGWRIGLVEGRQQPGLSVDDYPDRSALEALLKLERAAWREYLSQLSKHNLASEVTITTLRGHERSFPLWRVLIHLILHGMQHHSELAQALSSHGLSPGNIDFIFYSREGS
jgi:uncharacterized damage-inducible protein DinB